MNQGIIVAIVIGAYILGSIPFGLLLGKHKGIDVRGVGSGNIGASNVARTLGKKLGILVLLLDAGKAALPTLLAKILWVKDEIDIRIVAAIAFAGIVGHCYSIWLRFKGGKGVATSFGVFMVIDPALTGLAVLFFGALYKVTHVVSVGSISAAIVFPILLFIFGRQSEFVILASAIAFIIVLKHRSNIVRLVRGEENKV